MAATRLADPTASTSALLASRHQRGRAASSRSLPRRPSTSSSSSLSPTPADPAHAPAAMQLSSPPRLARSLTNHDRRAGLYLAGPDLAEVSSLLPVVDRSSRPAISRSLSAHHHHQHSTSAAAVAGRNRSASNKMVTPQEYDLLPPSIQKKYFSSVERLRIAQQSAADKRKRQHSKDSRISRPSLDASPRPKSSHSRGSSSFLSSVRPGSRRAVELSEQEALRFLSLPDKVKKLHFSAEEQSALAAKAQQVLASKIPDEPVRKRPNIERTTASIDTFRSALPLPVEPDVFGADLTRVESAPLRIETAPHPPRKRHDSASSSTSHSSALSALSHIRPASYERVPRSLSRNRAMVFAPIPLPPPTLAPAVPPLPPTTYFSTPSKNLRPADSMPTLRDTPPSTKYYKDNHARQRLREYVVSPEKFDEALEFGFPPQDSAHLHPLSVPAVADSPAKSISDDISIATSGDATTDNDAVSPQTPTFPSDLTPPTDDDNDEHDISLPASPVPTSPLPSSIRGNTSHDFANREMTLRLTLTRPDLRTPDKQLYTSHPKIVFSSDVDCDGSALDLSEMPLPDDVIDASGMFPHHQRNCQLGSIRKMWKNIRGR